VVLESPDRANGYWTTRSDAAPDLNARTSGDYLRATPEDVELMEGDDDVQRAELIAAQLKRWQSIANS
jgi:hypothetical protein